jgi:hypothetical protein
MPISCNGIAGARDLRNARALRILDDKRVRPRATAIVRRGQDLVGRTSPRRFGTRTDARRHGEAASTATPATRSMLVRRISGKPMSAVGSSLSMLSKSGDAERRSDAARAVVRLPRAAGRIRFPRRREAEGAAHVDEGDLDAPEAASSSANPV